jgi:hypothetical protein
MSSCHLNAAFDYSVGTPLHDNCVKRIIVQLMLTVDEGFRSIFTWIINGGNEISCSRHHRLLDYDGSSMQLEHLEIQSTARRRVDAVNTLSIL